VRYRVHMPDGKTLIVYAENRLEARKRLGKPWKSIESANELGFALEREEGREVYRVKENG